MKRQKFPGRTRATTELIDSTDQCERQTHDIHQALQVPWIPYILQPSRRLWHQVPHRSSHQSVWSTNQILVQPARWHLQQISHFPSHSNELTLVGMRSMVATEIPTDETWSLPHSKYSSHPKNIYVPTQKRKNDQRSCQKTILQYTMCREYDRSKAIIIHWESRTRPLPTSTYKTNVDYMLQQQQEERTTIHYK